MRKRKSTVAFFVVLFSLSILPIYGSELEDTLVLEEVTDTEPLDLDYSCFEEDEDPEPIHLKIVTEPTQENKQENKQENIKKKKLIKVHATAYTPSPKENGGWNITKRGNKLIPYKYIAVDPKTIPLGTKVYIPYFKNYPNKGIFIADDVGGAIKGNRIDVLLRNDKEARTFGRRNIDLYIIH